MFYLTLKCCRIESRFEYSDYVPPFDATHMEAALSLVTPHMLRWRSLMVLSDTWAPLHVGLLHLSDCFHGSVAPRLESLTLMRCNEYVSHAPLFQPEALQEPVFLHRSVLFPAFTFPKLTELTLTGVHADWNALHHILQRSNPPLLSLELSSHSSDVRPTLDQFRDILSVLPLLEELVIQGSGPLVEESADVNPMSHPPVALHHLEDLSIGYRSSFEAGSILRVIDAPRLQSLALEDATHPGDPEEVDAGSILSYISMGYMQKYRQEFTVTYSLANGLQYHRPDGSSEEQFLSEDGQPIYSSPFPELEVVRLTRVKAFAECFHALYAALPKLKELKLKAMSMEAVHPLLPPPTPNVSWTPVCPQLEALTLRLFREIYDVPALLERLTVHRSQRGICGMEEINICVNCGDKDALAAKHIPTSIGNTSIKCWAESIPAHCYDTEEEEEEEQAYELGGAFNDPIFDEWFRDHSG